jgi:hypothetical protein
VVICDAAAAEGAVVVPVQLARLPASMWRNKSIGAAALGVGQLLCSWYAVLVREEEAICRRIGSQMKA